VLAVGDYRFQQRAYERLAELARSGRPVVIVSHQLEKVAQLCSKAILLTAGTIHTAGSATECINAYLSDGNAAAASDAPVIVSRPVIEPGGSVAVGNAFQVSATVIFRTQIEPSWTVGLLIRSLNDSQIVFATTSRRQHLSLPEQSQIRVSFDLHAHLIPGPYLVELFVSDAVVGRSVCTSGPIYLLVEGDDHVFGRAHLGGRISFGVSATDYQGVTTAPMIPGSSQ
jgi:hypothetical protein